MNKWLTHSVQHRTRVHCSHWRHCTWACRRRHQTSHCHTDTPRDPHTGLVHYIGLILNSRTPDNRPQCIQTHTGTLQDRRTQRSGYNLPRTWTLENLGGFLNNFVTSNYKVFSAITRHAWFSMIFSRDFAIIEVRKFEHLFLNDSLILFFLNM